MFLEDKEMPEPDFIDASNTGLHLYYVLKHPFCLHDGQKKDLHNKNTGILGSGTDRAEYAGLGVIQDAIENALQTLHLCNKTGGIDHLNRF